MDVEEINSRSNVNTSVLALIASGCVVLYLMDIRTARSDTGLHSRVDHSGLSVDFSPRCTDGTPQLYGTITNVTAGPITIQSGSLPWQYDVLGSKFVAEASGSNLKRNWTAPIVGRTGPITLGPHEQQAGMVPISTLFPDLRRALKKGAVTIRWKYWTDVKTVRRGPSVFEDALVIRRDPCHEASR